MNTFVSPNIKKQSDRIDPDGNIINKRTKQVIEKAEEEDVPPVPEAPTEEQLQAPHVTAEVSRIGNPKSALSEKIDIMVAEKVASRINEIVDKKVEEILSNL